MFKASDAVYLKNVQVSDQVSDSCSSLLVANTICEQQQQSLVFRAWWSIGLKGTCIATNWIDFWKIQDIRCYLSQFGKTMKWSIQVFLDERLQAFIWCHLLLWIKAPWMQNVLCLCVSQSTPDSECPLETLLRFGCLVVSVTEDSRIGVGL